MKFVKRYMKPCAALILLTLFLKLVSAALDLMIPRILATMIDEIAPSASAGRILNAGIAMIVMAVLSLLSNVKGNIQSAEIAKRITRQLRLDLFAKTMHLSASQIDVFSVPSLESRLTSDTYNIHHVIGLLLRMGVRAPITLIGGILVAFSMDVQLTMVIAAMLPIITVVFCLISSKGIKRYAAVQEQIDRVISKIRENILGIKVIKALGTFDYERNRFGCLNEKLKQEEKRAQMLVSVSPPIINCLLNMGIIAVIYLGAVRVGQGKCEPGTILAFITYFTIISNAMISITRIFIQSAKAMSSVKRIQEVLLLPETVVDLKEKNEAETETEGTPENFIVFEHVNFSYRGRKKQIRDVSFTLKKGETLGVIGATGSGKSTLLLLLMRFYDVDSGRILITGRDVRQMDAKELHHMFGVVFQNDYLFRGSIYDNVSFGRNLSYSQVEAACGISQAFTFIQEYPDTYGYELSIKGSNISGGQKQRLLIARAVAAAPDILLLDDSSSALDYKTDSRFRQELDKYNHSTKIIVAQRISSVYQADKIIVLDKGHVIGQGTHDRLLTDCRIYKELYDVQMGAAR